MRGGILGEKEEMLRAAAFQAAGTQAHGRDSQPPGEVGHVCTGYFQHSCPAKLSPPLKSSYPTTFWNVMSHSASFW